MPLGQGLSTRGALEPVGDVFDGLHGGRRRPRIVAWMFLLSIVLSLLLALFGSRLTSTSLRLCADSGTEGP